MIVFAVDYILWQGVKVFVPMLTVESRAEKPQFVVIQRVGLLLLQVSTDKTLRRSDESQGHAIALAAEER